MTRRTLPTRKLVLVPAIAASLLTSMLATPSVNAEPGTGPPAAISTAPDAVTRPAADDRWIVTLGDSYISGEGGRWAGNTDDQTRTNGVLDHDNDALGATAYFDNPEDTAELIPGCHRSKSAEAHIRPTNTLNLACSGAQTTTFFEGDLFKPGIDFYGGAVGDANGNKGQAQMLQDAAVGKDVGLVVLSIGGNDFDFSDIATRCVEDYLFDMYCHNGSIADKVSPERQAEIQIAIEGAIENIETAMTNAGQADYRLLVQTYAQPIPYAKDFRYPESGSERTKIGGCPVFDADADWLVNDVFGVVNSTVSRAVEAALGPLDQHLIDMSPATSDRQLCQTGVGLLEEMGVTSFTEAGASDTTEWINWVLLFDGDDPPHQKVESLHPNYWAQLGLRSCLRQFWNEGAVRTGSCWPTGGITDDEPTMTIRALPSTSAPVGTPDEVTVEGTIEVGGRGVLDNDIHQGATFASIATAPSLTRPGSPDQLTARLVAGPEHGVLTLAADGRFTYTADEGYHGTDTFSYRPADFYGQGEVTVVTLTVVGAAAAVATTPTFTG